MAAETGGERTQQAGPSSVEVLQKTVEGLSAAFTLPYGHCFCSLENSNKMMEQMNTLLERFVLHAINVHVQYSPSSDTDGTDEHLVRVQVVCTNLSDFPLDQIVFKALQLPANDTIAEYAFSLEPHGIQRVTFELNDVRSSYNGTLEIVLPSPGTQAPLHKTANWEVPLPLRCSRQLRKQHTDAPPLYTHSSSVSASQLRLLFRQLATVVLETGPSVEYCFTLPGDGGVCIPTFVVAPVDHSTLLLGSTHPLSQPLLDQLAQLPPHSTS